ncbi:MAG: hypothetical protein ACTINM_09570 [Acetobacter cibinongensis]
MQDALTPSCAMMQNLEFRPLVMFHPSHPLARLLKWPLVAVTMMGFLGLLALQSFSLPDEMPRAAIERLLGVDIAPAPAEHSMMMHHGMSMAAMPQHTHHHDGTETCPLCPLLSLPAALPLGLVLLPPPCSTVDTPGQPRLSAARAPHCCAGPPAIARATCLISSAFSGLFPLFCTTGCGPSCLVFRTFSYGYLFEPPPGGCLRMGFCRAMRHCHNAPGLACCPRPDRRTAEQRCHPAAP